MASRREFLSGVSAATAFALFRQPLMFANNRREFDVADFGAAGDGKALDTQPIQKAIDAAGAAGPGARVLLRGGKRYLSGTLQLKGRIEFHLAEGATLLASTSEADYSAENPALLAADRAEGLVITGGGHLDGQAMKFMTGYSETDQRWEPRAFRPRMFSLHRCRDLQVRGISFGASPNWGLHLLGCDHVLVDNVTVRNFLDVPNCDGIDPDHCRDVEIRNCDVVSADDAIVIKTSKQPYDYGASHKIVVKDCKVTSRDSGLKIGTETFADISHVRFEHCQVISAGRGPTITHRQPGNISDIEFSDIDLVAEHHSSRWWGWGEAVSITVWPRSAEGHAGTLRDVRLRRIRGRAENSVRIDGSPGNPVQNVLLEDVAIEIGRWTQFPGGFFDNRPIGAGTPGLEPHDTPVFSIRNAQDVRVKSCAASWGKDRQPYFGPALEADNVKGLSIEGFHGEAAFPDRQKAIVIRDSDRKV